MDNKSAGARGYSIEITVTGPDGVSQGYGATVTLPHETPDQVLAMLEETIEAAAIMQRGRTRRAAP